MTETVTSLPSRPLTKSEVVSIGDTAREYCIRPESDEAYIITVVGDKGIYALGFDEDKQQWVKFHQTDEEYTDEGFEILEAKVGSWAQLQYGDRLDEGELRMAGPRDPVPETEEEPDRPPEVEQGLEPEYNCPDCGYYKTGLTTSPQSYLEHLREVHHYTNEEAHEILHQ
jgi:hypothetical protein